jgi:hypothetical protein
MWEILSKFKSLVIEIGAILRISYADSLVVGAEGVLQLNCRVESVGDEP